MTTSTSRSSIPKRWGEYRLVEVRDEGCEVLYDQLWPARRGRPRPLSRVRHRYRAPLTMEFDFIEGTPGRTRPPPPSSGLAIGAHSRGPGPLLPDRRPGGGGFQSGRPTSWAGTTLPSHRRPTFSGPGHTGQAMCRVPLAWSSVQAGHRRTCCRTGPRRAGSGPFAGRAVRPPRLLEGFVADSVLLCRMSRRKTVRRVAPRRGEPAGTRGYLGWGRGPFYLLAG